MNNAGKGAIGLSRCLMLGGELKRPLNNVTDPFCIARQPDESKYTLDHFYQKLLKLTDTFNTASGKAEATRRHNFLLSYLEQLKGEFEYSIT